MKALINKVETGIAQDLKKAFDKIILRKAKDYGKGEEALKSFLENLQHGGCISGMIGEFIYHNDCKKFYIKHINGLEQFVDDIQDQLGEPVNNRHQQPHYTFVVWLCFEEYCYQLYNSIFEQ